MADTSKSEPTPKSQLSLKEQLIYLEAQTWEALKKDGKALVPYLAPDCVMVLPGSAIFDRESKPTLLDILERSDMKPWTRYEMEDTRVVPLGRDAAMVCYGVRAARGEQEYRALISSVWRQSDAGDKDDWKMVLHQQTPVIE